MVLEDGKYISYIDKYISIYRKTKVTFYFTEENLLTRTGYPYTKILLFTVLALMFTHFKQGS